MTKNKLYEEFHEATNLQNKIIPQKNFTYRIILEVLNKYLKTNQDVLDIGCGAGTLALYCGSRGNNVLGIDISSKAIKAAISSANKIGLKNVRFEKMNFPHEIPPQKFNLIIMTEVLEHLEKDEIAIKKIYSLLKKDGILILSTPSSNAPLYKWGLANDFDKRVGHLRRYKMNDLEKLLTHNGFFILEKLKTEGVIRNSLFILPLLGGTIRFIRSFINDIVTFFDEISLKLFGESDLFVVVQKK